MGRLYGGGEVQQSATTQTTQGRLYGGLPPKSPAPQPVQFTGETNPIKIATSADQPGKRKVSVYTPLDYLLNGINYALAGNLEGQLKKQRQEAVINAKGIKFGVKPTITPPAPYDLTQFDWASALENLKPENRKTQYEVAREQMPNNISAGALGLIADLVTPTVPLVGNIKPLKVLASGAGDVIKQTKLAQQVAPAIEKVKRAVVPYVQYRGGQPAGYQQAAEAAQQQVQAGVEQARQIGELLSKGLTQAEQVRIGQIMKGGEVVGQVSTKLSERAKQARSIIDDLSRQLVEQAAKGGGEKVTPKGLAADLLNTLTTSFKEARAGLGETPRGWKSPEELTQMLLETYKKYQPAHVKDMVAGQFRDISANTRGVIKNAQGGAEVVGNRLQSDVSNALAKVVGSLKQNIGLQLEGLRTGVEGKTANTAIPENITELINNIDVTKAKTPQEASDIIISNLPGDLKKNKEIQQAVTTWTKGANILYKSVVGETPKAFTQTSEGFEPLIAGLNVQKQVAQGLDQTGKLITNRVKVPVEKIMTEATQGGIRMSDDLVKTIQANIGTYLPQLYRKWETNPEGLVKFLSGKNAKIIQDRLKQRQDIPDDVKTAMGLILEPAYPAAKAVSQMTNMIAKSKLLRYVNDNYAHLEPIGDNLKQIPDIPGYGVLAGKWVQKEIADDLMGVVQGKNPLEATSRTFGKLTALWKEGKLLYNPATRMRNQLTNMMGMNVLGGLPMQEVLNPVPWIQAATEYFKKGDFYKALKKETSLFDSTFYGNEIGAFLQNFGDLKTPQNAFERIINVIQKTRGVAAKTYRDQEELAKMMVAQYWVKQGKTLDEAAKIAEKALFDYSKAPPLVKAIRDFPLGYPFITFQYFAAPAYLKAAMQGNLNLARLARTKQDIESEAAQQHGNASKENLPNYMQQGQFLRLPFQSHGQDLYLDLNYILPWGNIEGENLAPAEPSNPAYRLPADLYRNVSSFTGKKIYDDFDSDQTKLKKVAEYTYQTLMPPTVPSIIPGMKGGFSWEKVISAIQSRPDYFGRVRDLPLVLMDVLGGLKLTPIDYTQTAAIKNAQKAGQVRDIESKIKSIQRDQRLFPEEKKKQIQALQEDIQRILKGE